MYQGKFDQNHKAASANIQDLLNQRQANADKAAAAKKPAPRAAVPSPEQSVPKDPTPKASDAKPAAAKPAPSGSTQPKVTKPNTTVSQRPVSGSSLQQTPGTQNAKRTQSARTSSKKRRGPRLGGVIFYTVYFLFILIFFIATFAAMQYIRGWLVSYEAAQPYTKAEQVFTQLFTDPDWEALYVASGVKDSPYEGKEAFTEYMNSNVDASELTYLETSAGLSGNKKFVVRMGSKRVASFTLADRNATAGMSLTNIPDWQLDAVEVFFQREGNYRIEKLKEQTVTVNGVKLDDSMTIQEATTVAQKYLPAGITVPTVCTQEVTGLMLTPTVAIYDPDGTPVEVSYDDSTHTFTFRAEGNTMSQEEKDAALGAAEASCKWMIRELTQRNTLAKYFDTNGNAYKTILASDVTWTQKNNGFTFLNESVTDYVRYSENIFSARVSLTLEVKVQIDGSTKTIDFAQSMFFQRDAAGNWLCFESVNRDVSEPVGRIRLTFMQGNTVLLSNFFQTDASELITPVITPPDGKVFSGWVRQDIDENGQITLAVVFQPDESGMVAIPDGTILTPMTLYALFEDADAGLSAA